MNSKLKALLTSRKFYAALLGLVFVFLGDDIGFDQEQITNAVYLLVTFIASIAYENGQKARG
jgi:hypothetical protein